MRRTKELTIIDRGEEKTFLLTEMSALDADKWSLRFLNALIASGVSVPDEAVGAGIAGLAEAANRMGEAFRTFRGLDMDAIEPLLDQLLACIQFKSSGGHLRKINPKAGDIEDIKTLWTLRRELLELHLGFSLADKLRELSASKTAKNPPSES